MIHTSKLYHHVGFFFLFYVLLCRDPGLSKDEDASYKAHGEINYCGQNEEAGRQFYYICAVFLYLAECVFRSSLLCGLSVGCLSLKSPKSLRQVHGLL